VAYQPRKPFLDPNREYPNGLGLSREEIEEGYRILAEIARERKEKDAPKESAGADQPDSPASK
jgi:hypothetical protein